MTRTNPLYLPYGAYELKAVYQRNMITTTLVLTAVLTGWLLSRGGETTPLIPIGPSGPPVEIKMRPPKSIVNCTKITSN